jgi:hypothetical protein
MDLAPDECTMYYGAFAGDPNGLGPFNVCTNTQESATGWDQIDDLRVLPNGQFIVLDDFRASLLDSSRQLVRSYAPPFPQGHLRTLSLDPDGTSFWMCCELDLNAPGPPFPSDVFRVDIQSGAIIAQWPVNPAGAIAVYSPPLFGDANVEGTVDSDSPGTAEAFPMTAGYSGHTTRLHLYVDASSKAKNVVVGAYADARGRPGALLEQATITNPKAGSWNYVDIPSTLIAAGKRYWIAVLGPRGGGKVSFRDRAGGARSQTSTQHKLAALPAQWSAGRTWPSSPLSAYGS